ncbi:MAG: aspartyl protease family protein [Planctomycetes bacterium]|nr:aspartyl protease family protein [Planctomycetota bacterium]
MRGLLLVSLGLTVGLITGWLLGRATAPRPEPVYIETLGSAGGDPAGGGRAGPGRAPSSQTERMNTRPTRRDPVESVDPADPDVLILHYGDREGRVLREGPGLAVDQAAGLVLAPLVDFRGAAFVEASLGGRTRRVELVRGTRDDLGLVLFVVDLGARPVALEPERVTPGTSLMALAGDGRRRSVEVAARDFDPELRCELLRFRPGELPRSALVLLDQSGAARALVPGAGPAASALPLEGIEVASFPPVDLAPQDWDARFYAGSVADLIAQARLARAENRPLEAVLVWQRVFELDPGRRREFEDELEAAWREALASEGPGSAGRSGLLARALKDLPAAADLWAELGELRRGERDWDGAVQAYAEAARLAPELIGDPVGLEAAIRLEQAQALVAGGRVEEARELLFAILPRLGANLDLWLLQAQLAERRRDYATAAAAWRAALDLDGGLAAELEAAIARAERLIEGPGRQVVDYDPRQRSIVVQVAINDRASGDFIIDTGATVSMVPEGLARAAGLDTSERAPKVRLDTAGSSRVLPYTPSGSIQLGSLRIEGLSVVVGDLSGGAGQGLLGMDFLQNFDLVNDTVNGRLVLSRR